MEKSKITDPAELRDLLLRGGLTLVSSGEAAGVLDAIDKLDSAAKKLPRMLLVRAFAECAQGHYQIASGYLAEATVRGGVSSESDRQFMGLLRDTCDFQAGRIPRTEFARRQKELSEKGEGEFGLSLKIDSL